MGTDIFRWCVGHEAAARWRPISWNCLHDVEGGRGRGKERLGAVVTVVAAGDCPASERASRQRAAAPKIADVCTRRGCHAMWSSVRPSVRSGSRNFVPLDTRCSSLHAGVTRALWLHGNANADGGRGRSGRCLFWPFAPHSIRLTAVVGLCLSHSPASPLAAILVAHTHSHTHSRSGFAQASGICRAPFSSSNRRRRRTWQES